MEVDLKDPFPVERCRLCFERALPTLVPHTNIGSFELYMLKQCVPDLVLDITLKPMKMCHMCSTSLSHFYRLQQTWQSEQKRLLARFIYRAHKLNHNDTYRTIIDEKEVNLSPHKFYCCRNGIFELYKHTEDNTLFPATSLNVDAMIPSVLKFSMHPKDNYRLMPVCEASKRVEALLLVPKEDFMKCQKKLVLRMTLITKTNIIDIRKINYAIVFYLGCEKERYFKVDFSEKTLPFATEEVSFPDNLTVTFCEAKDNEQVVETMPPQEKNDTSIHLDLSLGQQMSLPDLTPEQEMAPVVEADTPTDLNCEEQMVISDDEDVEALLNDIPEIVDEPEDCPDYVAITRCVQKENGQIVMINQEETVIGHVNPLSPPLTEQQLAPEITDHQPKKRPPDQQNQLLLASENAEHNQLEKPPMGHPEQQNQLPLASETTEHNQTKKRPMGRPKKRPPEQQNELPLAPETTEHDQPKKHQKSRTKKRPHEVTEHNHHPKKRSVIKVDDCFTQITEFEITKEGYYIEDHDYLAHPYKLNNYASGTQIYCNICRSPHHMSFHESHMSNHKHLACGSHRSILKFDNVYMFNQHLAKHVQECKLCGVVISGEFRTHSTKHRFGNAEKTERPRTSYFDFQLPKITKVESLSEVDPT